VQYAVSLYNLGSALGEAGSFEEMKSVLEKSLDVTIKKFGPKAAKAARVQLLLAEAYDNLGMHDKQLEMSQSAFAIIEPHCGKSHIQTSISRATYAYAVGRTGDLSRCIAMLLVAKDEQEVLLGPKHPQMCFTLYRLAWAHGCKGEYTRQKECLLEALEAQKRAFGANDQRNFDFFMMLAETCRNLNESDECFDFSKAALKTAEEKMGLAHFKTGRACFCCAQLYMSNRSFNLALKFSSRAVSILSACFGDAHKETKLARELCADAQREVDQRTEKDGGSS
jgi:tetratricopeptide (TPR) repeat protein